MLSQHLATSSVSVCMCACVPLHSCAHVLVCEGVHREKVKEKEKSKMVKVLSLSN